MGRILAVAGIVGGQSALVEHALAHIAKRKQFGKELARF